MLFSDRCECEQTSFIKKKIVLVMFIKAAVEKKNPRREKYLLPTYCLKIVKLFYIFF